MLRITKLADAEYLLRQVALGVEDYYMGSGEAPGVWQGALVAELGLTGVVEADHLRALLLGRDPITDAELLSARRPRTVTAFDVTFSAPKSVSLLWAFGSPEVASVASIAHVEAVAVALDFVERRAGATRQAIDGERQRISTGVAAATFVHRTSREGDPQLHSHCVVANLGRRPDGTFAALDATPLYEWGRAAGSVYQEELRRCLTRHLGVEWGPDRNGCREMAGFEPGWLRTFSKRTVAIDEYLAGAGPENPDPKHRMWADEAASLATRPRKDGSLTPEVLRERWQAEAEGIGMPTGHTLEAQVCGRTIPTLRPQLEWDDLVDALIEPEEGLCARRARFNEAHVVEHIAALGAGRLTVEALEDLAETFIASEHTVPLADRTGRTSPQYSTVNHLLLEERVLDLVGDLCATPVEAIPPSLVEEAIATEAPGLGADQADAVRALCAAGPAIRTVIARPGSARPPPSTPPQPPPAPPDIPSWAWPPPTRPPANSARPGSRPRPSPASPSTAPRSPAAPSSSSTKSFKSPPATPRSSSTPSPPPPAPSCGASATRTRHSPSGPAASALNWPAWAAPARSPPPN